MLGFFYSYLSSGLFFIVLASALYCFLRSSFIALKLKHKYRTLISFYFFASFTTSFTTIFTPLELSEIIIAIFYLFDFFIYYLILKTHFISNKMIILYRLTLGLLATSLPFLFLNLKAAITITIIFNLTYSVILSFTSINYFLELWLNRNEKLYNNTFYFWIMSSALLFNLSTIPGNTISIFEYKNTFNNMFYALSISFSHMCWIIKYFLLLNAVKCKEIIL